MSEEHEQVSDLTLRAAINQLKDLGDEIRRVGEKEALTEADETYLRELTDKFDEVDDHRKKLERQQLIARVNESTGSVLHKGHTPKRDLDDDPMGEPESIENPSQFGNPWDLNEMRTWNRSKSQIGAELRSRAFSAIEKMKGTNDRRREGMTKIIEEFDSEDGRIARMALHTSHPDYLRAFNKLARNPQNANLTAAENQAVERAMSLTDTAGGFLVNLAA